MRIWNLLFRFYLASRYLGASADNQTIYQQIEPNSFHVSFFVNKQKKFKKRNGCLRSVNDLVLVPENQFLYRFQSIFGFQCHLHSTNQNHFGSLSCSLSVALPERASQSGHLYSGYLAIVMNTEYQSPMRNLLFHFTCKTNNEIPQQVPGQVFER